MARGPRMASESGIYHVMVRGINQVQLFYDEEDREVFINRLARYHDQCNLEIFAWALMGNHVHLLVRPQGEELAKVMKRLLRSYSWAYNKKYDRKGYLYEGRFASKPVDSEEYFLTLVRYIHRNPMEAGGSVASWTSYNEYVYGESIADTSFLLSILAGSQTTARKAFERLVDTDDEAIGAPGSELLKEYPLTVNDYEDPNVSRLPDGRAAALICEVANVSSPQMVCEVQTGAMASILRALRDKGLSIRQIARLTGLTKSIVEKYSWTQ